MLSRILIWALMGALLSLSLGCSVEPRDAAALRRRFPEQAEAVLRAPAVRRGSRRGPGRGCPERGEGAVRFALPGGAAVEVRELGASGEGAPAEDAVVYARRGGASFWSGAEEWLWLDADAVRRDAPAAVWEVTGAALRERGDAVEVVDAERRGGDAGDGACGIRARGQRPVATRLATRLAARGAEMELWVEADGEEVLVDPGWSRRSKHADAGTGRSVVTPRRCLQDGRVLVAGGVGFYDGMDELHPARQR